MEGAAPLSDGTPIPGAPIQGTPEAKEFTEALVRAISKMDEKLEREFVSRDEMDRYVTKKGFGSLVANIRKEDGDFRKYTKPAAKPKTKTRKKRVRMAI